VIPVRRQGHRGSRRRGSGDRRNDRLHQRGEAPSTRLGR
jgi:hypothetical protein